MVFGVVCILKFAIDAPETALLRCRDEDLWTGGQKSGYGVTQLLAPCPKVFIPPLFARRLV